MQDAFRSRSKGSFESQELAADGIILDLAYNPTGYAVPNLSPWSNDQTLFVKRLTFSLQAMFLPFGHIACHEEFAQQCFSHFKNM